MSAAIATSSCKPSAGSPAKTKSTLRKPSAAALSPSATRSVGCALHSRLIHHPTTHYSPCFHSMTQPNIIKSDNIAKILDKALDKGAGLLRLTPTWVPRSFLHPGRRIKLFPGDLYAYGANRGGIDERWFASTTEAANEGRVWHEGLSFCSFEGKHFLLRDAVAEAGARLIGKPMYKEYERWPVYSKFFDNMGPIPQHM